MKHGSIFSGIGGFDLAAEWMGWENVFHCEWMPFPRQVLKYHFPNSISYEDITKTDFTIHRGQLDILTGGFPCQPYSVAGKRLGKEDERHLWPEMLRAIQEIEPTFVVGENVRGLVNWNGGLVFDEVQVDLENAGYEVIPLILPACAVGAPHRRDRVWFVARSTSYKYDASNSDSGRLERTEKVRRYSKYVEWESEFRNASDAKGSGVLGLSERKEQEISINGSVSSNGITTYSNINRLERSIPPNINKQQSCSKTHDEKCLPTHKHGLQFQNFPTQSPICSGDDGLPTELDGITFSKWRNESIKGYGNAVVPQLVYEIFKAIEQTIKF